MMGRHVDFWEEKETLRIAVDAPLAKIEDIKVDLSPRRIRIEINGYFVRVYHLQRTILIETGEARLQPSGTLLVEVKYYGG